MKSHIVLDTAFILAVIDKDDAFHDDAVYLFKELISRKANMQILIPPLVIYETIVTLRRKGVTARNIEMILLRLVNLAYVTVVSLSELSAFKHAGHALNSSDQSKALRTHDFLIFCVADEFDGLLITFDVKMLRKCKLVYSHAYYPSSRGNMTDDTVAILKEIDRRAGKDISKISYTPF